MPYLELEIFPSFGSSPLVFLKVVWSWNITMLYDVNVHMRFLLQNSNSACEDTGYNCVHNLTLKIAMGFKSLCYLLIAHK